MNYSFDEIVNRKGTNCYKWDSLQGCFGAEELLPFSVADSDFRTAPEIINALKERVKHGIFGYPFRDEEYSKATVNWIGRRHGWEVSKDWIVPLCGVVTSMSFAVQAFTSPGDKVLIQTPVYGPFYNVITKNRREIVENPLRFNKHRYEMDFDDLEIKCAAGVKMMLLCNPHNPVGRVWEKSELERVTGICRKYGVIIVSDEIHSDLIYKGHRHIPAGYAADHSDKTIVCTAASKSFNIPGLQTSNAIIPDDAMRKRYCELVYSHFIPAPNFLGMLATQVAYDNSEKWLEDQLAYLESNRDFLIEYINSNMPQIDVTQPEGTYLAWLDFRSLKISNEALMKLLVEKGRVALSNGTEFGSKGEGFMRFNFACPRTQLKEGLDRIRQALS